MKLLSVKQLAQLAGVSIRTLHVYDKMGLLRPAGRTEAHYRMYGEAELLRLQQILFYKELDFSLKDIGDLLDDPDFDVLKALESHRQALVTRQHRLSTLLTTIDKTILHLKNQDVMTTYEELYEGFPKEKAEAYRAEAIDKWGKATIEASEKALLKLSKADFEALHNRFQEVGRQLFALRDNAPGSPEAQRLIAQHYGMITQYWGKKPSAAAYIGLGEMYVSDERYTVQDGEPQPEYAAFLSKAMRFFAETSL